jgi:signal transduction histidine kinase/ligand-binding sensor domain-containing protein
MKKILLLIVILKLAAFGWAQEIKPIYFSDAPIGFLGMAQDSFGYIWLSDNGNGLYKFDGQKAIVYKPEPNNPNSLLSGRIENVFVDSEGILWLPHFEAGLDRFDSEAETFTHFKHNDLDTNTICSDATRDILEDLNGDLWVGTNKGLDKFDKKSGKFIHSFSDDPDALILRNEHIRKLYLDKSGIIWIGTGSPFFGEETPGGLFSLNPNTGEINIYRHSDEENSLIDNRVKAIFEDSRGVFWIGTAGDGLHTMDRETGTFTRHTYDPEQPKKLSRPPIQDIFNFGVDHITFIEEDEEGFIWIGTFGNGLNRYDPIKEITYHYGPNEEGAFRTDNISYWDILKTRDGLLWLTSFYREGATAYMLSKININPPKFNYLEHEGFRTVAQAADGQLYFGTNLGVQVLSKGEVIDLFKTWDEQNGNNQEVRAIKFDDKGNIWAGTGGGGLFFYNIETKELVNYRHEQGNPNSLSNDYVGDIIILENDEIFVATMDGLDILDLRTNRFEHFELKNVNFSNSTTTTNANKHVAIDGENRIWVAGSGGIFKFNRDSGTFSKYNLGVGNEIVLDLFIDDQGVPWIGTINHGLRRYNSENDFFHPILDKAGHLNKYSFVINITQDKNKAIWVNTNNHLIKYDLASNQGILFGDDWVPKAGRFTGGELISLSSGEIIFATRASVIRFQPEDFMRRQLTIDKPFIEKLIINDKIQHVTLNKRLYESFRGSSSIRLSHDQKDLRFQIGFINFQSHQNEQAISYKLENYDKDWRYTTSGSLIDYYRVPPGSYVFSIMATDAFGNWGTKNLNIFIAKPWYQTWWAYIIYTVLFLTAIRVFTRWREKRFQQEKETLQLKVEERTSELKKSLEELKSTQAQLIQSEKMASLGELTAGIAHEIQNPLNFVNNFSEVSAELLDEVKETRTKSRALRQSSGTEATKEEELEDEILEDIKQNLEKINHHGKRADAIVKGMLEHSRTGSGEKELTDINNLASEYLNLAYQSFKSKNEGVDIKLITDLDPTIPKIELVRADIGKVLLNILNNAFYAVTSKFDVRNSKFDIPLNHPTIGITTKNLGDKPNSYQVEISISDNGPGIPDAIKDKIFQPFFTTKPTGQGTGLGLSLSYDIVKAHGGGLRVDSSDGMGAEFIIQLPAKGN